MKFNFTNWANGLLPAPLIFLLLVLATTGSLAPPARAAAHVADLGVKVDLNTYTVKPVVAPVFVSKQYAFIQPEDAAPGTKVGAVKAADADNDNLTYTITNGNANNTFALDASTGVLTLAKRLQYHTQQNYKLQVKASDPAGQTDVATVSVAITRVEENSEVAKINWSSVASQPYVFYEGQGKVVNGKWYTFSGFDALEGFTPTSRSYVYDPTVNTWTPIAPMPPMNNTNHGGVTHAGFATDNNDIYFAGGYTANADGKGQILGTKEAWKYIVAENRYVRLPDLPRIVAAGQLEYLNGRLHYIATTDRRKKIDLGNHYVLDLNNVAAGWKPLAPLPSPRQHAGSAVYEGKIYFIGGQTGHDETSVATKLVHVYNSETNSWTRVADIPAPAGTHGIAHISSSVIVKGNQIIVLGGEYAFTKGTQMVSAYTPATNTWSSLTSLPRIMRGGVGANLAGKIYYSGGRGVKATISGVPLTNQKISSLMLVNADNGKDIQPIAKGTTLNLANLPTKNVSIRAVTNPDTVGSVVFNLSGPITHSQTESLAPYALFGGTRTKFKSWNPASGDYALQIAPYSAASGAGTIGSTLTVNFSVVNTPLIDSLSDHTGNLYALGNLVSGVTIYTDRKYTATSIPELLKDATFIKSPNNDKLNTSAGVFTFDLLRPSTLYVAYDSRATTLPAWLNDWQKITEKLGIDDPKNKNLILYSKVYPAGPVSFNGNMASPAAGALNNYLVIIKEQQGAGAVATNPNPLPETVNTASAPNLQVYPNPKNLGEKVFISLNNLGINETVQVSLHDMAGHQLQTLTTRTNNQGKLNTELAVSEKIRPGIYLIRINGPTGTQQQKLLVQ